MYSPIYQANAQRINRQLPTGEQAIATFARSLVDRYGNVVASGDDGLLLAAAPWEMITGKPATFPASDHAASHATVGSDPLAPGDIGAQVAHAALSVISANLGALNLSGTTLTLPTLISLTVTGEVSAGSFSGDGSDISGMNASNIGSGTLSYNRIPVGTTANTIAAGDDVRLISKQSVSGTGVQAVALTKALTELYVTLTASGTTQVALSGENNGDLVHVMVVGASASTIQVGTGAFSAFYSGALIGTDRLALIFQKEAGGWRKVAEMLNDVIPVSAGGTGGADASTAREKLGCLATEVAGKWKLTSLGFFLWNTTQSAWQEITLDGSAAAESLTIQPTA